MSELINQHWTTTITWIGHSTVLIQLPALTILTDPVFFARIGVKIPWLPTIGPKRYTNPALSLEELPPIDLVLFSHAHMDHMDVMSMRALTRRQPYKITAVTAYNTAKWIKRFQRKKVYELDRDQELDLLWIHLTAWETRHRWARYPRTPDRSREKINGAWHNSYLISYIQNNQPKEIVFGGDTARTHAFKKRHHEEIDVAIMPIGMYDPFKRQHCTPEEALAMADDMNTKVFIPIHRNTFRLSKEPKKAPLERLKKKLPDYPDMTLWLSDIGESYVLK